MANNHEYCGFLSAPLGSGSPKPLLDVSLILKATNGLKVSIDGLHTQLNEIEKMRDSIENDTLKLNNRDVLYEKLSVVVNYFNQILKYLDVYVDEKSTIELKSREKRQEQLTSYQNIAEERLEQEKNELDANEAELAELNSTGSNIASAIEVVSLIGLPTYIAKDKYMNELEALISENKANIADLEHDLNRISELFARDNN